MIHIQDVLFIVYELFLRNCSQFSIEKYLNAIIKYGLPSSSLSSIDLEGDIKR